ncbi:MAG TPA: glycosyltransferase [Anaeromyxobacteraceae bacterium]|nr:glycosyltransferase [Anaeromyxobacteraceae bacterium]
MIPPPEPNASPREDRPLRIAMVIDAWDEANNGAVVSTRRFTSILRARGHTVEVLATGEPQPGKVPLKTWYIPTPGNIMEKMRLPFAWPDRKILETVLSRQDVVHNQFPFWLGIKSIGVAHRAGVPVVSTFHVQAEHLLHNVGLRSPTLVDWTYQFFLRTTYDRSDAVLCPSAFAERELRRYGLEAPTEVISNGVPDEYRPLPPEECERFEGKFTILSVGRLAKEKRHDLLIEAIRQSRHEKRIQLVVLGDGPRKAQLLELGKVLSNPPVFRWLKPHELIRYYGGADLCVHAADVEVECMSVLEAMACGLPCIIASSPLSATPQFAISDEFLFPAGSREALTARIDRWIDDPEGLARARVAYREAAQRYRVEVSADRLVALYRKVIAARAGVRS